MKTQVFIGLLIAGIFACTLFFYSSTPQAAPKVQWTPAKVDTQVTAGQSSTTTVTFTPSEDINKPVDVRVVPELQPYVSTTPTTFNGLTKGSTETIDVTVSTSTNDIPGVYDGTIQLKQGNKTVAKPLPATVYVEPVGERVSVANGEISLIVPEGFVVTEGQNTSGNIRYISINGPDRPPASDSNPHPEPALTIRIVSNELEGIAFPKESYSPPLGSPNADVQIEIIDGREFIVVTNYVNGSVDSIIYRTDLNDSHFIEIYGESTNAGETTPLLSDDDIRYILTTIE